MIDLFLAATFLALLSVAMLGGVMLSVISSIGLVAIAAIVIFSEAHPPVALLVFGWMILTVISGLILRRLRKENPSKQSWVIPIFLAGGQFVIATTLLWGGLMASDAEASPALRAASLYPVVAGIGAVLPETSDLSYPPPAAPGPQDDGAEPARPIDWAAATAFDGIIARTLTGTVQAAERAPLAFEADGRIEEITVEIGDAFRRGDVLARLDDTTFRNTLAERRAALVEAEARHVEAEQDLARQRSLFERGVVAEARLEAAQATMNTTISRLEIARTGVQQAEDRLDDAALLAPYDGSVAARYAEPAQTVASGAPVFEVQGESAGLQIAITVPEALISQLEVGSEHPARLLNGSNVALLAVVHDIGTRANSASGFPVTLTITAAQGPIRAGMSAEVELRLPRPNRGDEAMVSVPMNAILPHDGTTYVAFVFDPASDTLTRRAVSLSGYEGDFALIGDGLKDGDIVATRGLSFLRDGMPVSLRGFGIARYDF